MCLPILQKIKFRIEYQMFSFLIIYWSSLQKSNFNNVLLQLNSVITNCFGPTKFVHYNGVHNCVLNDHLGGIDNFVRYNRDLQYFILSIKAILGLQQDIMLQLTLCKLIFLEWFSVFIIISVGKSWEKFIEKEEMY